MNYLDILDNLVPDKCPLQNHDIMRMYEKALEYLNTIKLSRNNAMYFGSMQIGPEVYSWKDDKNNKDFSLKYESCCIMLLTTVYQELKDDKQKLIELSLSVLYSMLALFVENKGLTFPESIFKLLKENDKYYNKEDFDKEFEE